MKIYTDYGYAVIDECGIRIYRTCDVDNMFLSYVAIPIKPQNKESYE